MERISRRDFLKRTAASVGSVILVNSFGSNAVLSQASADMSRVVVITHPEATNGVKAINDVAVQDMVDESMKQLTGETSVAGAWMSVLPDFKETHVIAIKVNAISSILPSHPELVNAVVTGLTAAGVRENNIIIYDNAKQKLTSAGYKYNASGTGVRCLGTDEKGWGYDPDNPVAILDMERLLSSIVTRCDHLINVPVLKVHLDQYGATLALKNHYGSVDNPQSLHANFPMACAALNNQRDIKNKTRLVVTDALFGCCGRNANVWGWLVDFAPNSLIVSKDPVAADYIGVQMLNEERAKHDLSPRNVPLLKKAAQMGLGTNDPKKMELRIVNLG